MKQVVAINGSPKEQNSVSAMLINQIENILGTKTTVYQATKLIRQEGDSEVLSNILKADTLLIVFPLYVDSLPAPLVKLLTMIEQETANTKGRLPVVYAVCNCGFYEAEHNRLALNIVENFAIRSGLSWGYGIGVGCGGFLLSQSKNMTKGSVAHVYTALQELGSAINEGGPERDNVFITPKIPRIIYKFGGNMGWRQMAKKYGTQKSLRAKPHLESSKKG